LLLHTFLWARPSLLNSPGSRIVAQKEIGDAGKDGVPWSTRKEVVPPLF
jgi:hypothetical protein